MDWLNNVTSSLLSKDLDGLWVRQKEISNNLSNLETPGYKSRTVSFEDQLQSLMSNSDKTDMEQINEINKVQPRTTISDDLSMRLDGNNVDVEKENIELARTQINYWYSLRTLSDYFARLKTAIDSKT
ncbi:flagellar basal body rod protein FlgB [Caproiciproducens galactitolivorans]|uniref:Flagellar basal body rod protein FlgB n=1 Tax=Caproiciproducens galactitolivorans TaxID=642589 RepID=A0A4Z0Y2E0_9FIRM|nr:flagellar basal body rod protein FlgB [Caproiciproducens galactitolivorans]QEY34349.1 flagellar basal body rod protein FlgB [Caproiciproducens galactitolivorans]TGJ77884.1 flagellar basal body rod protein FlgB [Caproiciproducens galactitolivorans]